MRSGKAIAPLKGEQMKEMNIFTMIGASIGVIELNQQFKQFSLFEDRLAEGAYRSSSQIRSRLMVPCKTLLRQMTRRESFWLP